MLKKYAHIHKPWEGLEKKRSMHPSDVYVHTYIRFTPVLQAIESMVRLAEVKLNTFISYIIHMKYMT